MACVQALAPGDFLCGILDVHVIQNDCRRFSAEFKRHAGMNFCRLFCHMGTHVRATRKEHMIEGEGEQLVANFGTCALHNGDFVLRENVRNQRFKKCRYMRRLVARLCYHHIAGSDGCDDRRNKKQERVIPRCHNQHAALGFEMAHA